ncbi:hypothetical protein ACU686_36795 [Yinghuangia aomiensis]
MEVLDSRPPDVALPTFALGPLISCGPDTRRRDAYIDVDETDFIARANRDWFALATSSGLLDAHREFLPAIGGGWYRVRLLDEWDVMGTACATANLGIAGRTAGVWDAGPGRQRCGTRNDLGVGDQFPGRTAAARHGAGAAIHRWGGIRGW